MKEREKKINSRECINDPCNAKECQNTNCINHNSKTKETHKCFFECKKGSCFGCNEVLQKRIITRNKIIEVMERFIVNSNSSLIASKLKTFIYQKSFNEIYSKNEISLFTIKFYIFIFFENANEIEKEAKINKLIKKSDSERWANYKIESYLDELEIRINLLMDNKISITNFSITKPRIEDILSPACDVGDYDFAFYVLQSQPYFLLNILEEEENLNEFILEYIISLFCNGRREEMYLCRFIEDSVCRIEKSYSKMIKKSNTRNEDNQSLTIKSTIENIKLYNALRLLLNHFFRGCDTKFKDALLKIIENLNSVDIENDPSKIYSNLYGRKVSIENALENNAVRVTFITRIKTLRAVIISIVETIKKNIINLPFPVRYFFKHIFRMLNKQHKRNTKTKYKSEDYNSEEREREEGNKNYQNYNEFEEGSKSGNTFNDEAQSDILDSSLTTFMLSIFYKDLLFPFLIAPDAFTNFEISRFLRDKLKMINKAFECIIEGKRYTILKSLDKFFNETHYNLSEIMNEIADVNDIDKEFLCLVSIDVDKPHVVYSGRQVNSFMKQIKDKLRRRINKNKAEISRKKNDENITKDSFRDSFEMINNMLGDLSINKRNTKDELQNDSTPEYRLYHFINNIKPLPETNKPITFYLNKPFVEEKKDSEKQKMFEDVKMKIVRLLKFANGRNILDMLVRQSSEKEEESFIEYQLSLITERRNTDHSVNNSLLQYLNTHDQGQVDETLAENEEFLPKLNTLGSFKDAVFDDMIRLEETGLVSKDNFYNEMLYALADDIIRIKLMSLERNKKLESLNRFLVELHDRRTRLNKKIVVHEKYLFSLISSMMNKKVGLEGYKSYKESANKLANKGILVNLEGNMNKSAKDIHFLFQTEEAGVFTVNLYINKKTNCGSFRFRFDDILKLKFEGREEFMIDKICILNVSKLIDYINKRYIAE